ncbi:MAG: hypothetical protein WDO13_04945 [Verrucomicrobiota bacterium]
MILLAEHDEPTLAAKKKRQHGASSWPTSTPKNRVWGFENTPSGRPVVEPQLTQETAAGSVQYTYQIASGRAEWLSRDPLGEGMGTNLYDYVGNCPIDDFDSLGLWQTNINIVIPLTPSLTGVGINITFGNNSGQWNVGGLVGVGEGLLFSAKTNFKDSGCEEKGGHIDLGANLGAGFVEGLSGSGKMSVGADFQTLSLSGSVTGAGPLGGATVNVGTGPLGAGYPTNPPSVTTSPTIGGSLGAGGMLGGGGHYTW